MNVRYVSSILGASAAFTALSALGAPVDVTIKPKSEQMGPLDFTFRGNEFRLCHTEQGWEVTTFGAQWTNYNSVRPKSIITTLTHRASKQEVELGFENNKMIKRYPDGDQIAHDLDSEGCLPIEYHQIYTATFAVQNKAPYNARFSDLIAREIGRGHLEEASALLKMPRAIDVQIILALKEISTTSSKEDILAVSNTVKDIVSGATSDSYLAELAGTYVAALEPKEVRDHLDAYGLPHLIDNFYMMTDALEDPIYAKAADWLSQLQPDDMARLNSAVIEYALQGGNQPMTKLSEVFSEVTPAWAKMKEIDDELVMAIDEWWIEFQSPFVQFTQVAGSVSLNH